MLWVVQDNLFIDNKRGALLDTLARQDIPFVTVEVGRSMVTPDITDDSAPILTNGSVMLSNIARARGWQPGSLFNENFSYDVWAPRYRELMLNNDAVFTTLGEAKPTTPSFFARPILDNKTFNGRVFTHEQFADLQRKSLRGDTNTPSPDTAILMARPKAIGQEHRHYIVDGHIITSSRYKLAGQPNFREGADGAVLDVVRHAMTLFQPARAFVMDTYIAGREVGIVEIGGICHAGLYEANLMNLVHALDSMPVDPMPAGRPRSSRP